MAILKLPEKHKQQKINIKQVFPGKNSFKNMLSQKSNKNKQPMLLVTTIQYSQIKRKFN